LPALKTMTTLVHQTEPLQTSQVMCS